MSQHYSLPCISYIKHLLCYIPQLSKQFRIRLYISKVTAANLVNTLAINFSYISNVKMLNTIKAEKRETKSFDIKCLSESMVPQLDSYKYKQPTDYHYSDYIQTHNKEYKKSSVDWIFHYKWLQSELSLIFNTQTCNQSGFCFYFVFLYLTFTLSRAKDEININN